MPGLSTSPDISISPDDSQVGRDRERLIQRLESNPEQKEIFGHLSTRAIAEAAALRVNGDNTGVEELGKKLVDLIEKHTELAGLNLTR